MGVWAKRPSLNPGFWHFSCLCACGYIIYPLWSQFATCKMRTITPTPSPPDNTSYDTVDEKTRVEAFCKIFYKSLLFYFTMQSCFLDHDFGLWGIYFGGRGDPKWFIDWKADRGPASSLPCVVDGSNALTMWYEIRREQIKGSLSKQLSQIESNLEYSFFDIITERVLDPIVFNF